MVVKGIRFGETWGMGCGPIAGPTFVEVMVYDNEGNSSFIVASILDSDLKINVSDYPLFDVLYSAFDGNSSNFDKEMEKAAKLYKTDDDYDVYDEEEGFGHYYPGLEKAVDLAVLLLKEGCGRHTGLHAAGVVIGREPLANYVPLSVSDHQTGGLVSQYTMLEIEDCGLVKMDFLGLKTLTLIKNCTDLIHKKDPGFDIEKIPEYDQKTFEMLQSGDSDMVFQFESPGMKKILCQAKPNSIEDLVALNALYRPGSMEFIPKYINSKAGREEVSYPDPCLEDILSTTYGVIVYQEQVMQVAQRIAG